MRGFLGGDTHQYYPELVRDITAADAYGHSIVDQQIFDAAFRIIADAQRFVVLDMFLFNTQRGARTSAPATSLRPLAEELTRLLIDKRRADPQFRVLFITDPINDVYGGEPSPELKTLRAAGVDVVVTDLDRLRDRILPELGTGIAVAFARSPMTPPTGGRSSRSPFPWRR